MVDDDMVVQRATIAWLIAEGLKGGRLPLWVWFVYVIPVCRRRRRELLYCNAMQPTIARGNKARQGVGLFFATSPMPPCLGRVETPLRILRCTTYYGGGGGVEASRAIKDVLCEHRVLVCAQ